MNLPLRSALTLALCTLVAILVLGTSFHLGRERLASAREQWRMQILAQVLPAGPFDTEPPSQGRLIMASESGSPDPLPIHLVYRDGQALASVLTVIAPDGYNGNITLLLGVHADGHIIGARVSEHRETPGLGDDIEIRRSEWIRQFDGLSLDSLDGAQWNADRRGGHFDALTGATITSQAVIRAIQRALHWFSENQQEIFSP